MVHRRVFDTIGYFDNIGGYEDDDFFRRARRAKFRLATTGRAFIHHFGSVTQKSIKASRKMPEKKLGDREAYRRKTGQAWIKRKITQVGTGVRKTWWKKSEFWRFGRTLHEKRISGWWEYF
jgi:GT2 family glycosyltransferase